MPIPLIAGLPPDLLLSAGYVIRVNALDQSTGAEIGGVALENVSIFVSVVTGNLDNSGSQPFLVPSAEPT